MCKGKAKAARREPNGKYFGQNEPFFSLPFLDVYKRQEDMVRASSINVDHTKILALAIANGCIGLSGALLAQYQGFADISSGIGIVAVGLASVIIGERIFGRRGVTWGLSVTVAGSVIYRLMIALALKTNLFPAYCLKIVSAVIVAAALSVPAVKQMLARRKIKREGLRHAVHS